MRIAFFETTPEDQAYLKGIFPAAVYIEAPLSTDTAAQAADCEAISVFIYSKVDQEELRLMPKLRFIATRSTGYDHINLADAEMAGVAVANVPYYGENTVAEHTFALILALSRNVHKSYVRTLQNDFSIDGLQGFDLKGKTLGVIGAGHIGLHVIRIAKGFGMHVLVHDQFQNQFLSEVLHYQHTDLDELLARSDIITLHLPYMESTHHLINRSNIGKFKKGAILINTARGALVETDALIEGLDQGILSGAGLDVLEGEEFIKEEKQLLYQTVKREDVASLVKGHMLLERDNVVYTPHIAFYSAEALQRILETTAENIRAFEAGAPVHLVRPK